MSRQDFGVTEEVKRLPGVPLLYIVLNTVVLEKPSEASQDRVAAEQSGRLLPSAQQHSISSLKERQGIGRKEEEGRGRKRKRKRSNPNPLSCLKKKKKKPTAPPTGASPAANQGEGEGKKGRSRSKRRKTEGGTSGPGGPEGSQ